MSEFEFQTHLLLTRARQSMGGCLPLHRFIQHAILQQHVLLYSFAGGWHPSIVFTGIKLGKITFRSNEKEIIFSGNRVDIVFVFMHNAA